MNTELPALIEAFKAEVMLKHGIHVDIVVEGICFECGQLFDNNHHVVPEVRGGKKTVPLCAACHGKAHHRNKNMATSDLTKAGLASAKLKGVKLGSARLGHWDGKENKRGVFSDGMKQYLHNKSEKARQYYAYLLPRIKLMRENGDSIQQIVDWLNNNEHVTSTGKAWSTSVLYEVMSRYMQDENLLVEEVA